MCTPPILVGATLKVGVISLMRKTLEPCSWRLIVWRGSCATNDEGKLRQTLIFLLVMRGDGSYKPRSRTPPSKSFVCDEDYHCKCRNKSPSRKGLGNDTMSKVLNQISRSPFTHRIGGNLPQQFTLPMFTMYNGQIDSVEYVSHFNRGMVVHSRNEALLCKVFPSSLGPVAMRWFDDLGASSIDSFKKLTQAFESCFITCYLLGL